jgi:hypothetical protein
MVPLNGYGEKEFTKNNLFFTSFMQLTEKNDKILYERLRYICDCKMMLLKLKWFKSEEDTLRCLFFLYIKILAILWKWPGFFMDYILSDSSVLL